MQKCNYLFTTFLIDQLIIPVADRFRIGFIFLRFHQIRMRFEFVIVSFGYSQSINTGTTLCNLVPRTYLPDLAVRIFVRYPSGNLINLISFTYRDLNQVPLIYRPQLIPTLPLEQNPLGPFYTIKVHCRLDHIWNIQPCESIF